MKKGCFLTSIIIFTILIGTSFYIIDKYGDDILFFVKGRVLEMTTGTVDEYIEKLAKDKDKEQLKIVWNELKNNTRDMEFEEGLNYISVVLKKIDYYTKDSSLTNEEINSIREFAENESE
ncbi:MAG: hypothetical protein U5K00_02515 [Melioribacteraceae bacterium]|nr:hypothetical protein [Melioribacteraceae bacterium]